MNCLLHGDSDVDATVGYLCVQHFSRLRSSLLELPAIAVWLHCRIATGGSSLTERVSGSSDDPIPLRLDVLDLIGPVAPNPTEALVRDTEVQAGEPSMFDELRSWAELVKDESGFPWTGDDRKTLVGAVGFLTGHLSWIAGQPWVDEFATAVRRLGRQAHRVAPWRAEVRHDPSPCPACNVRAVVLHIADGVSRCEVRAGGCGRVQPISEYVLNAILPKLRRSG